MKFTYRQVRLILFSLIFLFGCAQKTFSPSTPTPILATAAVTNANKTKLPPIQTLTLPEQTPTLLKAHSEALHPTSTNNLSPTPILTPTPDTRLKARYWREWPVVPELSNFAIQILVNARQNHLDPHSFSKVGDCQLTTSTFLAGYVRKQYPIPPGMEETVEWFSQSMTTESITSYNGLGINSVLNPMFGYAAGHKECEKTETPLTCELRIHRPSIVLIGMGTNWKPQAEIRFEEHLRQAVEEILATGALPILATKADNVELDWKINEAIARVAYDYDLPLVNVWRSVQDLPNHGLEAPPKQIYLTPDGWMRRNEAWLKTLYKAYIILRNY